MLETLLTPNLYNIQPTQAWKNYTLDIETPLFTNLSTINAE